MPRTKADFTPSVGPPDLWPLVLAILATLVGKFIPFVLLYALYNHSIDLGSDIYLADLPVIGGVIEWIDEDLSAQNLLAMVLAGFSVAIPFFLWMQIFDNEIHKDPGAFFSNPINMVWSLLGLCLYAMVFLLEYYNIHALIAHRELDVLGDVGANEGLMDYLDANRDQASFIAAFTVIINTVFSMLITLVVRKINPSN